jgi:hypothetical protein
MFSNLWDGQIRMGLKASNLWQDFWGVEAIMKGKKRTQPTDGSRFQKQVAMGIYKPRKPWSAEALLSGLKKLYSDENMTWRCLEQEQALEIIMSGREQVVAVLPTGSGKSLLFMLPCTLPGAQVTTYRRQTNRHDLFEFVWEINPKGQATRHDLFAYT